MDKGVSFVKVQGRAGQTEGIDSIWKVFSWKVKRGKGEKESGIWPFETFFNVGFEKVNRGEVTYVRKIEDRWEKKKPRLDMSCG